MHSDPSAEPADKPLDPAQPPAARRGETASQGAATPAQNGPPDADAAEPVPHEHLPSRSDDN